MAGEGKRQMLVLRQLDEVECMSLAALADFSGLKKHDAGIAAGALIARNFATRRNINCYLRTSAGTAFLDSGETIKSGPPGPLTGHRRPVRETLRDKLWVAIRIKQKFTIAEIVELSVSGQEKGAYDNAMRFVLALHRAGYLRQLDSDKNTYRFQLMRNSGEGTPIVSIRSQSIHDPNMKTNFVIEAPR
jgi:hypothetical protein